jgi:hypothetical protein
VGTFFNKSLTFKDTFGQLFFDLNSALVAKAHCESFHLYALEDFVVELEYSINLLDADHDSLVHDLDFALTLFRV